MKRYYLSHVMLAAGLIPCCSVLRAQHHPNVVFVLADEWRAQDVGYNGNRDVITPNLDKLAKKSIRFTNVISTCPVCCPYRASLMTGQYPLTTGVFMNDVLLNPEAQSLGKCFLTAGYETAYIGKWHLDGHGRSSLIPEARRQGFDYWKVLECTHDYLNSWYWDNDDKKQKWDGYDAFAQTKDAVTYLRERKKSPKPFFLFLSWGPPHTPFETAPESFKRKYRLKNLELRANVPADLKEQAINDLIGYYGHISALDSCIGVLQQTLAETGLDRNTIFIFTSDHGNMVRSHGLMNKQQPYEESILVPMLIRFPALWGDRGKKNDMLIGTPDLMPTMLGLCGIPVPGAVEGKDKSPVLKGECGEDTKAVLIASYQPFGQWPRKQGGVEYRGVRTKKYTYVKTQNGPWLLFNNRKDPCQLRNLIADPGYREVRDDLDQQLEMLLKSTRDQFLPGMDYVRKWGYVTDETGTIPYLKINFEGKPITGN